MGVWNRLKRAFGREPEGNSYFGRSAYDAGAYDRLNAPWSSANMSAQEMDTVPRDIIRARARDLERNSDMANALISAFRRNVVGKGWRLQAYTDSEELNTQIEYLWEKWCSKRNCDVTGMQNLSQMARMAIQRKKIDGGILFKKCYTQGGLLPFKLQALEVDELDKNNTSAKIKGNRVCDGIEFNQYNKPVGYWIKQYSLDGWSTTEPVFVPAKDIIFIYTKIRPSQIREISDMSATATRIRDANEYMTAVSVKERIAACLAVFIKKVTRSGAGRDTIGNAKRIDYEGKSLRPGMIKELNPGDDVEVVNPAGQAADACGLIQIQERMIGAGQGISYESISRDMSKSTYSSARQGMIEDEMTFWEDAELLMETLYDEAYETFIISCVLAGKLVISDFWQDPQKYMDHKWVPIPKKWIDPVKEANATKIALASGQKTLQQVAGENGMDWKEQLDEMAQAIEYAKKKGIDLGGILYGKEYNRE